LSARAGRRGLGLVLGAAVDAAGAALGAVLALARDLAPPGAGLAAGQLEEVLVEPQVLPHPPAGHEEDVPDLLDEAVREVLHLDLHPCEVAVEPVERDDATVLGAVGALPDDPLVRVLLEDLGRPAPAR